MSAIPPAPPLPPARGSQQTRSAFARITQSLTSRPAHPTGKTAPIYSQKLPGSVQNPFLCLALFHLSLFSTGGEHGPAFCFAHACSYLAAFPRYAPAIPLLTLIFFHAALLLSLPSLVASKYVEVPNFLPSTLTVIGRTLLSLARTALKRFVSTEILANGNPTFSRLLFTMIAKMRLVTVTPWTSTMLNGPTVSIATT
jgi:hypothetical protein